VSEKLPTQVQADVAPDKATVVANPEAPSKGAMSRQQALARRNALVKELFRTVQHIHPPKPPAMAKPPESHTEVVETKEVPQQKQPDLESEQIKSREMERKMRSINGVSLDLYDYFSIDANTNDMETIRRLQYINSWVATEGQTFAGGMQRLHDIDTKLGSADTGETKLIKLYNWIKFNGNLRPRKV